MSNILYQYFDNNPGRLITKWEHYFSIYERHFKTYRSKPIKLLEYGVSHGGSLQMWREYFHPQSLIVGVDIDPKCLSLAEHGIEIVIGDQESAQTHALLRERYGDFDIVIDDGGHTMQQQIATFKGIYPAVKVGGLYVAEDLHTSYLPDWGGGIQRKNTFIEYSKLLIDQMHAWYSVTPEHQLDGITSSVYALHFYDSILVIEKAEIKHPTVLMTGKPAFGINASEYLWLAGHHQRKGNLSEAIDMCHEALRVKPDSVPAKTLLKEIEIAMTAANIRGS
jgi:hypothetical protein